MKTLLLAFCLINLVYLEVLSQDNVGIGTTTPNSSAILELSATDKGFLVPRLTTAQRNAISSPATGLIIFNTESGTYEYYSGSSWIQLFSGSFLSLTNGRIFVGNASNQAVAVNLSGDATIDNTGVLTIGNDKITTAKILDGNVTNAKLATGIDAAKLADGSISNTEFQFLNNVSSNIQTQLDSKASSTLNSGNIFVGNVSNVATGVAMSGDATINNTGVLTIGNDKITTAKILDGNVTSAKLATGIDAAKLADGSVNNTEFQYLGNVTSDIQTQLNAKITNALTNGNIFVGNGSNVATPVAMSGDATISNTGVLTIGNDKITTAKLLDGNVTSAKLATGIDAAKLADGSISNTEFQYLNNVSSNIQTQLNAKMSNALPTGYIFVGDAGGVAVGRQPSGNIAVSVTGALNIQDNQINDNHIAPGSQINVNKLAEGPATGNLIRTNGTNVEWWTPNFLTTETVGTGTSAGGDLSGTYPNPTIANNAVTTAKIADNNVTGAKINLTGNVAGDMMYYDGTDWIRLGLGSNNQVLSSNGTIPLWTSGATIPTGTDKQTLRFNGTTLEANSTLLNYGTKLGVNYSGTIRDSVVLHIGDGTGNDDDVLIDGDLIVTGTIDPLAIQLIPQASAPVSATSAGFMYYNSTSQTIKVTNGTSWSDLGSNLTNGLDLKNTDDAAKELKFYEPSLSGTNYTAFKAQTQSGNVTYTLPAADGTDGQVLTTNGSGGLSWEAPGTATLTDTTITGATTINGNHNIVYLTGPSNYTVSLPNASSFSGKTLIIKAKPYASGSVAYILQAQSGQNIDITSTKTLQTNGTNVLRGITIKSDGSNWIILSTINY